MKRILIVTRSYDHQLGGMEVHTSRVANYLAKQGYEVSVLTPDLEPLGGIEEMMQVRILRIGPMPGAVLKYSYNYWNSVRAFIANNADKFDVIINVSMSAALINGRVLKKNNLKLITILHGTYANERRSLMQQIKHDPLRIKLYLGIPYCILFSLIQKRIMRTSDKVIAISNSVYLSLKDEYNVSIKKLELVENFVDILKFTPPKRNFQARPMKILVLSRLHPQKGINIFLQALRHVIKSQNLNVKCQIVGNGPAKDSIEEFISTNKLGKYVSLHGGVPNHEVRNYMKAYDFYVFPTLAAEGQSLSLIEAMAMGMVCLASDITGPNELIFDNQNGYLFAPGNWKSLSKRLINAYDDSKNEMLSIAARKSAVNKHNEITQLNKIIRLIND